MTTVPTPHPESLYALVPAVYRIADHDLGGPLRALLRVLEEPYRVVEADIQALYDDWFIETCAPWLVPYLAELVGVSDTLDPAGVIPTVRARVGDALAYARRKGPAWVLAQAAGDATGWGARAVESFQLLSQTQDLGDVRAGLGRTADLRLGLAVEAGTPFDPYARTVEVRGAGSAGRWAADRVALFLWRLRSYPLPGAQARPAGAGRFTLCPFGAETPLFIPPRTRPAFGRDPAPWEVPGPVSRELLARVLEEEGSAGTPWESEYPVLRVWAGEDAASAVRCQLRAADLGGAAWDRLVAEPPPAPRPVPHAAVDPARGRIAFLDGAEPAWVGVEWSYGFGAELGGGPYARGAPDPAPGGGAFVAVIGRAPRGREWAAASLAEALGEWAAASAADGVVLLADSAIHPAPPRGTATVLPAGRRLWIVAAPGQRPCLKGDLNLHGLTASGVILDGILVDGTVRLSGALDLTVLHCTLGPPVPGAPAARRAIAAQPGFAGSVAVRRSVLGPLGLPAGAAGVALADSIVAGGVYAVASGGSDEDAGAAPRVRVERCTVLGLVRAHAIDARDSIFTDPVLVDEVSTGGLTCCYAPWSARSPGRERCLPAAQDDPVRPFFTSTRYGDPAFAQLDVRCAASIRTGASSGAEMGAFHLLDNPRREANLRAALDEFVPYGLEPVVSYVT